MPDLSWVLYDTAVFNTVATTAHELFQVSQGSDSTHTEDFTNSPGAGSLPSGQNMEVKAVGVYPEHDVTAAELVKIYNKAWLELKVSESVKLKLPLSLVAAPQEFNGAVGAAAGSGLSWAGPIFDLEIPIPIPGGTQYKVTIMQVVATAAAEQLKVCLFGTLTRP